MFRIDSEDAVAVLPSPAAAGPIAGYFHQGDPGIGQEATVVSYDWMNALQETVIHPIEEAGIALDKAAPYDLLTQAIKAIAAVPIGSIIPFYDFNGALAFDTDRFAYCDGSSKTIEGIGSQTLPDLSNRYLVGFGTEGGGDMDTAAWDTAAVGLASHQANLAHTHTGPSHSHTLDASGWAQIAFDSGSSRHQINHVTATSWNSDAETSIGTYFGTSNAVTKGASLGGSTNTGGTGATGSALSATQSIQPRSIRVRFLMRIA
jgi:hypothetical protein